MRRSAVVAVLAAAASVLAGCTSGGPALAERPAIFDRAQTADDVLPLSFGADHDAASVRYAGTDSAGDHYWAASSLSGSCIVWRAADGSDWSGSCGGLPLTMTAGDGLRMEFASAPRELTADSAETVGDTILVQRP